MAGRAGAPHTGRMPVRASPLRSTRPRRRPTARPRGFSLVEQLAVLALAGAVTAGAAPLLTALDEQARSITLARLAAGAATAMALNQAGCLLTDQRAQAGRCLPVRNCADLPALLMTDLPAGYAVQPQALPPAPEGARCLLRREADGAAAAFHGVAAGH